MRNIHSGYLFVRRFNKKVMSSLFSTERAIKVLEVIRSMDAAFRNLSCFNESHRHHTWEKDRRAIPLPTTSVHAVFV